MAILNSIRRAAHLLEVLEQGRAGAVPHDDPD